MRTKLKIKSFLQNTIICMEIKCLDKGRHWVLNTLNPHHPLSEVPKKAVSAKSLVCIIRDPFQQALSHYFFRKADVRGTSLLRNHVKVLQRVEEVLGHVPKGYTFDQFVRYIEPILSEFLWPETYEEGVLKRHDLSLLAYMAIRLLAPDPMAIFKMPPDEFNDYFLKHRFSSWLDKVHVIHQENLNREFHDFLLSQGYEKDAVAGFLIQKRSNRSRNSRTDTSSLWTDELRQFYYDKSWVLFEMFPEYKSELKDIKLKSSPHQDNRQNQPRLSMPN